MRGRFFLDSGENDHFDFHTTDQFDIGDLAESAWQQQVQTFLDAFTINGGFAALTEASDASLIHMNGIGFVGDFAAAKGGGGGGSGGGGGGHGHGNPLSVTLSADQSSFDSAGQVITYTYTVSNSGSSSLTGVTVSDDNFTPANSGDDFAPTYVSGDADGDGELDATESWVYTSTHTVTQTEVDAGASLTNTATADSADTGAVTDSTTVTFSGGGSLLDSYTSGLGQNGYGTSAFNIEIDFSGTWTAALQQTFIDASETLSSIITGDLADVFYRGKIIDDVRIDASLANIDGSGGILGQAGPTAYRTADYLPAVGSMQFDTADANDFQNLALFNDIVFHEMMHVLGFGTMWSYMDGTIGDILSDDGTQFIGTNAVAANGGQPVEIEQDGGSGTAGGHWDEVMYGAEIMTGYISGLGVTLYDAAGNVLSSWDDPSLDHYDMYRTGDNTLAAFTVGALDDMGYDVSWNGQQPDILTDDSSAIITVSV